MKIKLLILSLAVATFAFKTTGDYSNLKLGSEVPMIDHNLKDVSGKTVSLKDVADNKGLLVIFSCNTCPFVVGNGEKSEGWENRYNKIFAQAEKAEIGSILINSNEAKRTKGDSFKDMIMHAERNAYSAYYAIDTEHKLADAFGAKTTPHVFLFDGDMKLIYQGAIDDNVDSIKGVKVNYLKDAIVAYQKGEDIPVAETKPVGCSIKRVSAEK